MKVSFIVPVYNIIDYLPGCIESIVSQELDSYEILLIDDGSTDGSGALCDGYAEKYDYIRTFHKENGGVGSARNVGVENARGEYIFFTDGDDYYSEHSLKGIVDGANGNDMVVFDVNNVFPDYVEYCREGLKNLDITGKSKEEVLDAFCTMPRFIASVCSILFKRELLVKNNMAFGTNISEDLEYTFFLFLHATTIGVNGTGAYNYRRTRENSITSSRYDGGELEMLRFIGQLTHRDYLSPLSSAEKRFAKYCAAYEYTIVVLRYSYVSRECRKKIVSRCKEYKYLLDCASGKRYRLIKLFVSVFGLYLTSRILKIYTGGR